MKSLLILALWLTSSAFAGLTIGTYNIRNFDYDERYRIHTDKPALEAILKNLNFDLLGVNEINNVTEFEQFIATKLTGFNTQLSACGGAHGQRLGFIYNTQKLKLLSFNEDMSVTDPTGRNPGCFTGSRPLAIAYFEELATGDKFYAMQVHLKSGGNAEATKIRFKQYQLIEGIIKDLLAKGHTQIVISGDFNTTGYALRDEDFHRFTAMVKNTTMIDLSAEAQCSAYWWGGSDDGIETPSLLDHVVVTPAFLKKRDAKTKVGGHCQAVSCQAARVADLGVSYEGVSDHCPQTVLAR